MDDDLFFTFRPTKTSPTFFGAVKQSWAEKNVQRKLEGKVIEPLTVKVFQEDDMSNTMNVVVDKISVSTRVKSTIRLAKYILRSEMDPWQALLAYNREFLQDKILGTMLHFGPLILDQSSSQLQQLNNVVFTVDGQGRLCPDKFEMKKFGLDLEFEVEPTLPLQIKKITRADLGAFINRQFVQKPTAVKTFQKAYLDFYMEATVANVVKVQELAKDKDLYVIVSDKNGNLLIPADDVPSIHILTVDQAEETEFQEELGGTFGGKRKKSSRKSGIQTDLSAIEEVLGKSRFRKLPDLINVNVQERTFCQKGPSLLEKMLTLFSEPSAIATGAGQSSLVAGQNKMSQRRQSNPLQNAAVGSLYGLGIGALTGNAGRGAAIGALSGLALGGVGRDIGIPGFSGGKKGRATKSKGKKSQSKSAKKTNSKRRATKPKTPSRATRIATRKEQLRKKAMAFHNSKQNGVYNMQGQYEGVNANFLKLQYAHPNKVLFQVTSKYVQVSDPQIQGSFRFHF